LLETGNALAFYRIKIKVPVVCSVTAVVPLRVDGRYYRYPSGRDKAGWLQRIVLTIVLCCRVYQLV
jgi:hypothetical protein